MNDIFDFIQYIHTCNLPPNCIDRKVLNTFNMSLNINNCVSGGMQDWNYLNTNCFEVTIELGCVKYPMAKDLPGYWEQNRRALLQFIHQVTTQNIASILTALYSPRLASSHV